MVRLLGREKRTPRKHRLQVVAAIALVGTCLIRSAA
jgi:hypothetical protein